MGILGAAMMTGAFGNNNNAAMMQTPPQNQYQFGNQGGQNYGALGGQVYGVPNGGSARRDVFCLNCSKKFPVTNAFCPYCGDKYNPCPMCGADNFSGSTRCITCGANLAQNNAAMDSACSKCGTPLQPGLKFCPNCGVKIQF